MDYEPIVKPPVSDVAVKPHIEDYDEFVKSF